MSALLPSERESAISSFEKFGPKKSVRVPHSDTSGDPAIPAPAPGQPYPSEREGTVLCVEKFGPKSGASRNAPADAAASSPSKSNAPSPAKAAAKAAPAAAAKAPAATAPVKEAPAAAAPVKAAPAAAAPVKEAPAAAAPVKAAPAAAAPVKEAPAAAAPVKEAPAAAAPVKEAPAAAAPVKEAPAAAAPVKAAPAAATKNAPAASASASDGSGVVRGVVIGALAVGAAALTVFSIYKGVEMYNRYMLQQCVEEQQRTEPDVVHLYIHPRSSLAPSIDSESTRLETFLRVARIPYEVHPISDAGAVGGVLPAVTYDSKLVAGAAQAMEYLSIHFHAHIDDFLTKEQRAEGKALLAALDYSVAKGCQRSLANRVDIMQPYYAEMNRTPSLIARIALSRMRTQVNKTQLKSGYGLLSNEQYEQQLLHDVLAIEDLFYAGDKNTEPRAFLFSNTEPSSYDCALYAFLLPIVAMPEAPQVNEAFNAVVSSEALTGFVHRLTSLAFPDLDDIVCARPATVRSGSVEAAEAEGEGEGEAEAGEEVERAENLDNEAEPIAQTA